MKDREIARKDGEIAKKDEEIAIKNGEIITKDGEIVELKRQLQDQVNNVGGSNGTFNGKIDANHVTLQINQTPQNTNNPEVEDLKQKVDHRDL